MHEQEEEFVDYGKITSPGTHKAFMPASCFECAILCTESEYCQSGPGIYCHEQGGGVACGFIPDDAEYVECDDVEAEVWHLTLFDTIAPTPAPTYPTFQPTSPTPAITVPSFFDAMPDVALEDVTYYCGDDDETSSQEEVEESEATITYKAADPNSYYVVCDEEGEATTM